MNKISRQTMIDYVLQEVARGSIYVWGAQGQRGKKITKTWIKNMETSTTNANRAIAYWEKSKQTHDPNMIGAFDCSGLIGACLNANGNPDFDDTANGYLGRCVSITKDKLEPGDFVFEYANGKSSHIGVYVGDGYVVEARGRDHGVCKTKLNDRNWKKYGRPDFIYTSKTLSNESKPSTGTSTPNTTSKPAQVTTELPSGTLYYRLKATGNVYLRAGGSVSTQILDVVETGQTLRYRGETDDFYYVSVDVTGKRGFVSKKFVKADYLPKTDGIKALQRRLDVNPDGLFGRATAIAVAKVQTQYGLTVDYIYGPNTKKVLEG